MISIYVFAGVALYMFMVGIVDDYLHSKHMLTPAWLLYPMIVPALFAEAGSIVGGACRKWFSKVAKRINHV